MYLSVELNELRKLDSTSAQRPKCGVCKVEKSTLEAEKNNTLSYFNGSQNVYAAVFISRDATL